MKMDFAFDNDEKVILKVHSPYGVHLRKIDNGYALEYALKFYQKLGWKTEFLGVPLSWGKPETYNSFREDWGIAR